MARHDRMRPRLLCFEALLGMVVASVAGTASGGSIQFTNTVEPGQVRLHVTIVDDGGADDCEWFYIHGQGADFYIPRSAGTTTHELVATNVPPNATYFYTLEGKNVFSWPPHCDASAFAEAFGADWYPAFVTIANVGPGPIPQKRGVLSSAYGEPWSAGIGLIYACSGILDGTACDLSSRARQYLDTGTVVLTYGTWFEVSRQHGFGLHVESAVPVACPNLAVESHPWSSVKILYR